MNPKIKNIEDQFWKYVLPSMMTMLLVGCYAVVDGFFVGRSVGDKGLAAINIAWPVAALFMATGIGIGSGGSVLMSLRLGEKKQKEAARSRANTIVTLLAASLIFTVLLHFSTKFILRFFGAEGEVFELALSYLRIVVFGASLQIMGSGLSPILKNMGRTVEAMIAMITGLLTNILLDALFIMSFGMGIAGAALATIMAQGLVAFLCFVFIVRDKQLKFDRSQFKPDYKMIIETIRIGLSPFGLSLAPSVIIIFANWQCLRYGGEVAVAAYSVISYVLASVQALLQGVGDGVQPIISYCKGANNQLALAKVTKKAYGLSISIGILLFLLAILSREILPVIFGTSVEAAKLIEKAMLICGIAFPFIAVTRLSSSYFYATENIRFSTLLVYIDPLFITPVLILLLPFLLNVNGIWLSLPAAQILLFAMAVVLLHKAMKQKTELKSINSTQK